MPIDTSMYNQNPLDSFSNSLNSVMQFKNMSDLGKLRKTEQEKAQIETEKSKQEFGDQQALRGALQKNLVTNQDGSQTVNHAGVLADLNKVNLQLATDYGLKVQQQSADALSKHLAVGKQLAWSIPTDPNTPPEQKQAAWDQATAQAMKMGVPGAEQMPRQYPGDNFVKSMQFSYLSPEEKLNQHKEEIANKFKGQEADARSLESRAKAAEAGIDVGGAMSGASSRVAANGKGGAAGNSLSEQDPADLLKRVPAKDRDKVAAEIDAAKNATENGPKIMNAHDNAYGQHGIDYIPGTLNADQKNFHALLGPTFKDVEGTVRQAAMDNMFSNTTPQFGDNGRTKGVKREAVKDYLSYKSSAALSKAYGIDLSKFKSTNVKAALDATDQESKKELKAPPEGSTKDFNGKTYKVVGDHWVAVTKEAAK